MSLPCSSSEVSYWYFTAMKTTFRNFLGHVFCFFPSEIPVKITKELALFEYNIRFKCCFHPVVQEILSPVAAVLVKIVFLDYLLNIHQIKKKYSHFPFFSLFIPQVLMDAATTESLYKIHTFSADLTLKHKTDTVIKDVSVIEQLILDWQIWERCPLGVTELLFAGLECLVREGHLYQNYNVKQYTAINIVNKIFKIYQVGDIFQIVIELYPH